jgi:hypothetical protein
VRTRLLALAVVLVIAAVPAAGTLPVAPEPRLVTTVNPIATDEVSYQAFARVFSDPHGCLVLGGTLPSAGQVVSPWAKGRACAIDYLSYSEVVNGARFLAQRFPDLFEVIRLDEAYGNPDYTSAGLPRALAVADSDLKVLGRDRSPLYLFKVTDAASDIPEEERLHFAYSLSIHGLERAGLEGGVRAMEDLVTWAACEKDEHRDSTPACELEGPFPKPIVESDTDRPVPTAGETLRRTVSYFFLPNPDGQRAGQKSELVELRDGNVNPSYLPGVSFTRGNGNGVDLNRDWPAVGYTQRSHQPWSEPETRAFGEVLLDIRDRTASGVFAGGIDLHGMSAARAFSYTLLGADQRDYRKNAITVDTSLRTWEDQTARLTWSPYIGDSTGDGVQDRPAPLPVADEWGSIYDTLGYTITGGLGNWMDDSRIGLGGVGINNEMALSNIAPNTVYEPALNQTHIDGNKGLIYSQIASLLYEDVIDRTFRPAGRVGYVLDPERLTVDGRARPANPGLPAQRGYEVLLPCQDTVAPHALGGGCDGGTYATDGLTSTFEFEVHGPEDGVWNGGLTVTSTRLLTENGATVSGSPVHATARVERLACDHGDDCEWVVEKDLARTAVTVNDPQPGRWRVVADHVSGIPRRLNVDFDPVTAEASDGQLPIDTSPMDFFTELNEHVEPGSELVAVAIEEVVTGAERLSELDTLIVVHDLGRREHLAGLGLDAAAVDAYLATLERFAAEGGNLVLTDAALHALEDLGIVEDGSVAQLGGGSAGSFVASAYHFDVGEGLVTYRDPDTFPLAAGLDLPGAAELETGRRQAVEPTPLGYNPNSGSTHARMPFWGVDRGAWEARCHHDDARRCTTALVAQARSHTQLGEIAHGEGVIRVVGSLLPDPRVAPADDTIADNRFGLASYAITYTAYQVFENLVDHRRP